MVSWAASGGTIGSTSREVILLSTREATPAVLCLVLISLIQERNGHTGKSVAKGHRNDERTGVSVLLEMAERVGTLQPRDERPYSERSHQRI